MFYQWVIMTLNQYPLLPDYFFVYRKGGRAETKTRETTYEDLLKGKPVKDC